MACGYIKTRVSAVIDPARIGAAYPPGIAAADSPIHPTEAASTPKPHRIASQLDRISAASPNRRSRSITDTGDPPGSLHHPAIVPMITPGPMVPTPLATVQIRTQEYFRNSSRILQDSVEHWPMVDVYSVGRCHIHSLEQRTINDDNENHNLR